MLKYGRYLLCTVIFMLSGALLMGCQASKVSEGEDSTTVEDVDGSHTVESGAEHTEESNMLSEIEQKSQDGGIYLRVDPSAKGKVIGNKVSNMNVWTHTFWSNPLLDGYMAETYPFVDTIQFMAATGGEDSRDLFVDPTNKDVLDDYDFAPLINSCRNVVDQGINPMIKTGNIPSKFSTDSTPGAFGVNLYPPDDYGVYYNYIQAMTQALVDEFGLEEVRSWRWGCFTEYENGSWFMGTCEDFCKIYDYTTAAIQSVLGFDIKIGAHSMTVTEGHWDEREFIDHCINGTNYCTGEQGTRLTYLSVSYYEDNMSSLTAKNDRLVKVVDILRNRVNADIEEALASGITQEHLDQLGVTSIYYGVDEGRILAESPGRDSSDLISRVVGHTKQGAYDAMLLNLMVREDIDYFSAWEYCTDRYYGLPTVSYHVANEFYKMVGTTQVESTMERHLGSEALSSSKYWDALTSVDEEGNIYVMAYAFGETTLQESDKNLHVITDLDCQKARVTVSYINDDANFFDEWMEVCAENGMEQSDFLWSPDGTQIPNFITYGRSKQLYYDNLTKGKNLTECSKLTSKTVEVDVIDGQLNFCTEMDLNTVVFLKIEPIA